MKKITLPFAVIACIILFSSCQKDTGGDPPTSTDKVKSYTEDITSGSIGNSVTTYNLAYDASNRIISIISASNPGDKFLFTYNSATTFSMDIYNSNTRVIHEDFFLNSNSYPDSTFQYNNTGDTATEKSVYNGNNQVIKLYEYDYSKITGSDLWNTTTYTYDAGGNLVKAEDTDANINTYEYYPDLVYISPVTEPYAHPKKHNLLKKNTLSSNGFILGSATFTYTFDSNNRISTEKAVVSDGSIILKTYTYF
jgi:YD repeat-containing protein